MLNLQLDSNLGIEYKNNTQVVRKVSEAWALDNLYCLACDSDHINETPNNSEAVDFICPRCEAAYQLKASKVWNERRVPDAGYDAMMRSLHSDSVPNLLLMHYSQDWLIRNLLAIPSFFFTSAAVAKRKPLASTARRAGWVGCNILLSEIADEGKIKIISNGLAASKDKVRGSYNVLRPLADIGVKTRGWTLDVLRMIRRLDSNQFQLRDIYSFEIELARIYPGNKNIRPKIRQQLQVLRDLGFISFLGNGRYQMLR